MPLATSVEHGNNLQAVQLLLKKNQVTRTATVNIIPPNSSDVAVYICFATVMTLAGETLSSESILRL